MDKVMLIVLILGGFFLVVAIFLNPAMAGTIIIIVLPFLAFALYGLKQGRRTARAMEELKVLVRQEKEDVLRDIKKLQQRQQEQYEHLRDYGRDLAIAQNKEQLLRLIVTMFGKATRTAAGESHCFLISHVPGADEFEYEIGYNFDSTALKATRFSEKDEVIDAVVKSKKIVTYLSDIFSGDTNIRYFLKDDKMGFLAQLGSLALIPLLIEEEVWGIVVIFCGESAAALIKNEESFFLLMVSQASIALGNAIHRGLASVDRLTQLYNRNFLQKRLKEEIEFCNRQQLPMSILMIDIDNFKNINDTYGHHEGDVVLKHLAQVFTKSVRLTDVCARYGGEEFVIVLPGISEGKDEKISIAERIRAAVEATEFVVIGEKKVSVTVSIGVTVRRYPADKDADIEELIKRADTKLYQAKKEGRNRVCYPD